MIIHYGLEPVRSHTKKPVIFQLLGKLILIFFNEIKTMVSWLSVLLRSHIHITISQIKVFQSASAL